jgi:hypothetical protein
MIKVCRDCSLEFDKTWIWGTNQCKPCNRQYQKRQRIKDVEGAKVKRRAYTARPYVKQKKTDYDQRRNYGITSDEKATLLLKQGGCAICGTDDPGQRPWHTDHNHKTNEIRGILCHNCNMLLGHAKDSIEILEKGICYLSLKAPQIALVS